MASEGPRLLVLKCKREKRRIHVNGDLKPCGYPNWPLMKSQKRPTKHTVALDGRKNNMLSHIIAPCVERWPDKLTRIFPKHDISVQFKPSGVVKQRLVHPKDKIPKHKLSIVVYVV